MLIQSFDSDQTAFPKELIEYSEKIAAQKDSHHDRDSIAKNSHCLSHAAPLKSLHQRDFHILADLFERKDIEEIESNINTILLILWPEPCWEDNLLEFLREYFC